MSIKVWRHGNKIAVENPITRKEQVMINVTFIEEGRSGGDAKMSDTSAFLSRAAGEEVGLNQLRTHTHPVLAEKIGLFPLGKEFAGHINRGMYSTPQLRQQVDVDPRQIDGRPTYFRTWISDTPEADQDFRMDINTTARYAPKELFGSRIGATNVRVLETADVNAGEGMAQDISQNRSEKAEGKVLENAGSAEGEGEQPYPGGTPRTSS